MQLESGPVGCHEKLALPFSIRVVMEYWNTEDTRLADFDLFYLDPSTRK